MNGFIRSLPEPRHATQVDSTFIIDAGVLAILFCIAAAVVTPGGDFPLNDDWSYGMTVRHLLETGDYRPPLQAYAPLVTNVLWGSIFSLPGGFSFNALRASTLLASFLGLVGSYVLVRDLQQPRWLALLVALTLCFNPIYFELSYTFMTDVLFTALATWAMVFLSRSLRSASNLQMLTGTALALAGTLSRQLAVCIPLAFAVTVLLNSRLTARTTLRSAIPLISCVGAFLAFRHWLASSGRMPALLDARTGELLQALTNARHLIGLFLNNTFVVLVYLGLFLLPILALSMCDLFRSYRSKSAALMTVAILIMTLGAIMHARYDLTFGDASLIPMPIPGNVLISSGVGPLTLRDTFLLHLNHRPDLPAGFWIVVTALGLLGAGLLLAMLSLHTLKLMPRLLNRAPNSENDGVRMFLVLSGVIYLLPLLVTPFPYDRYFVPTIPLIAAGIAGLSSRLSEPYPYDIKLSRLCGLMFLTAFAVFSVSGTRDYLAWNRLRWEALHYLAQTSHVGAKDVDGGYEFNGLYLYDPAYRSDPERSYWWVQRDTYQIGFGPVPGYATVKEYTYSNWLPPHLQKVVVLRKQ
jgi:hypothetical protein